MPNLEYEKTYDGAVCGVDEVGRGPWSGPVVACAVVLKNGTLPDDILTVLDDSKKLTAQKRQALYEPLMQHCHFSIGQCSVDEIDELNILQATMKAMKRAIKGLNVPIVGALIDGNKIPDLNIPAQAIIKGDSISISIAAASVIAKIYRDTLMQELALQYPHYGWESNAGYGTKKHIEGLEKHGITQHHRKSYAPIKKIIQSNK